MGFLSDVFDGFKENLGSGLATGLGGGVAGGIVSSIFGGGNTRNYTRENRIAGENALQQIKLGNALDLDNQKNMFDYRIRYGLSHGMTPYEMLMGPAAGAGGGTSSSGATLGNQASEQSKVSRQLSMQQREGNLNRATDLAKTAMQAQAQVKSAELSAGATKSAAGTAADASRYSADIQKKIADQKLQLSTREFEEVVKPAAALNLDISEQELLKAVNEVANTDHKWVRRKTLMQLGVDNGIQQLILNRTPYDITDPKSVDKMSPTEYSQLLTALLGAQSHMNKEIKGLLSHASDTFKAIFGPIADWYVDSQSEVLGRGEASPPPKPKKSRPGNYASEPIQGGPNMRYR